ncbi:MAG TPA: biliverdin-producing heme oxygenase, partial [Nitrospira sp.]|nr:biliverdin-producing heme oxygenase [Nitrospira sp.]
MILTRLRAETDPYHDRLQRRLPLLDPQLSRSAYRDALGRLFGFYVPFEAAIESTCVPAMREDMVRRRKSHWLIQDLFGLGATPQAVAALPLCRNLPSLDGYAGLLGALYAVEGETLLGPVLSRYIRHALGEDAVRCCRFLSSYGRQIHLMWETLLENLAVASRIAGHDEMIIDGARRTLASLDRWLAGSGTGNEE